MILIISFYSFLLTFSFCINKKEQEERNIFQLSNWQGTFGQPNPRMVVDFDDTTTLKDFFWDDNEVIGENYSSQLDTFVWIFQE